MKVVTIDKLLQKFTDREPTIMGEAAFRKYGVLVPLVEINEEIHLLFEIRAKHLRSQPGDICFPGGKMDAEDPDPKACALRETEEELGLGRTVIQSVYPLDYLVSESGRMIYPFIGYVTDLDSLNMNHNEVADIFTVPLAFFQQTEPEQYQVKLKVQPEEDFPYDLIYNGEDYNWHTRRITESFYQYGEHAIWGLTAKIILHFLQLLKSPVIEKS